MRVTAETGQAARCGTEPEVQFGFLGFAALAAPSIGLAQGPSAWSSVAAGAGSMPARLLAVLVAVGLLGAMLVLAWRAGRAAQRRTNEDIFNCMLEAFVVFDATGTALRRNQAFDNLVRERAAGIRGDEERVRTQLLEEIRRCTRAGRRGFLRLGGVASGDPARGHAPAEPGGPAKGGAAGEVPAPEPPDRPSADAELVLEYAARSIYLDRIEGADAFPGLVVFLRDVTERVAAEERFGAAFEQAAIGMAVVSLDGKILRVNEQFSRMVGYEPAELLNRGVLEITHPDDIAAQTQHHDRLLAGAVSSYMLEKRYLKKDGTSVWGRLTVSLVHRGERPADCVIALVEDITLRRNLEAQLRHAQKMDAIGQLAGGVAHDFNNLLTAIQGHAALLGMDPTLSAEASESVDEITQASRRAANLTRQLLVFSRREVMQPRPVNLNDCVSQLGRMLQRLIGENVRMRMHLWPHPLTVRADSGMLDQVLINLAVNARDAMPRGGELVIATCRLTITPEARRADAQVVPGRYACLTVRDTGCGIRSEDRLRIFEPFYTTKPEGKGTGLGLATVFAIVEQHHGWIEVESEVGQGATFRLFFPVCQQPADGRPTEPVAAVPRGRGEIILIVEDDELVRQMAAAVLRHGGYSVVSCANGREALEWWGNGRRHLDALFTDLVLPDGLRGDALAARFRADQPRLKIILTSGYATDKQADELAPGPNDRWLSKPYQLDQLLVVLDELLHGAGGRGAVSPLTTRDSQKSSGTIRR